MSARSAINESALVFDIEVAGLEWEEIDEATRHYLMSRASRKGEEPESVKHRLALIPGLGRVVAIGIWRLASDGGGVLVHGSGGEWVEFEPVPGSKVYRGNERELLEEFWRIVDPQKCGTVVTYNGRGYDGPILMTRSAMLGIAPSRNLTPNRFKVSDHCDLFEVLHNFGAIRDRFSLDYWCRRYQVESPKGKMDGSMVGEQARAGRYDEIAEYCLRDVRATADLFRKVEPTLLPLYF